MLKSSWNAKLLVSSTLMISAITVTPIDFESNSFKINTVDAAATYYTTTVNLNLRKSASTSSTILLTIPSGKTVTYLGTSGSWYKVSYNGTVGYVSSQYLKTYKPTTVKTYTTTANLNLRKSASTSSSILTTIPNGKEIIYLSTSGSWFKVSYNGTIGYVSSDYVKVIETSTQTPETNITYKTTVNLNLRTSASTSGSILTTIPSGEVVNYIGTYGSWFKVSYNGMTGYVSSQYLAPTSTTEVERVYSTTANLNLRQSTSTSSTILLTIPSGSTVDYLGTYGSWYKVTYKGVTGYVSSEYVKVTTTSASTKTVVIDAGHGGNDPGAVYGSLYEKVIALDIAKRLANTLTSTYNYNVKLTRSTDTYLSLSERVSLSKSYKADVFVSLHANSSVYSSANGHEVLVPTSESYTTNPYISASRTLGSTINKELGSKITMIQNRGVKYQNVYVVGKNVAPSTLVEYGFISNSSDRSYLTNTSYRQLMAEATASGIDQFMRSYY
ncbi:SH3 domain-containing protein [Exiguobacterium sp. s189]|uniref:SH3 domain-containing protein n=1 Tax=Exiguobacterium sp. s189 TaxID=2751263 RepID=UPI002036AFE4|nr:SH3 domain-containing protein [Exiguobacterium sp. s189]